MAESIEFKNSLIECIKQKNVLDFKVIYDSNKFENYKHDYDRELLEEVEKIIDVNMYEKFIGCGIKIGFNHMFRIQRLISKGNYAVLEHEIIKLLKEDYFMDERKINGFGFDLENNETNLSDIMKCLNVVKFYMIRTKKDLLSQSLLFHSSFGKIEIFDHLVESYKLDIIDIKNYIKDINCGWCKDSEMDVYISMLNFDESFLLTSTLFLICHKNKRFLEEIKRRKHLYPLIEQYFKNLKEKDINDTSDLDFREIFDVIGYRVYSYPPSAVHGLNKFFEEKKRGCYYCCDELKKEDDYFISRCKNKGHIFHESCAKRMGYLCFKCIENGQSDEIDIDDLENKFKEVLYV